MSGLTSFEKMDLGNRVIVIPDDERKEVWIICYPPAITEYLEDNWDLWAYRRWERLEKELAERYWFLSVNYDIQDMEMIDRKLIVIIYMIAPSHWGLEVEDV